MIVWFIPTYKETHVPPNASWFYKSLEDSAFDFRFPKDMFKNISFFVVGLGDSTYKNTFCHSSEQVDSWLSLLGLIRVCNLIKIDMADQVRSETSIGSFLDFLIKMSKNDFSPLIESKTISNQAKDSNHGQKRENLQESKGKDKKIVDIEDLGKIVDKPTPSGVKPEMMSAQIRQNLQKQGYKLVGSHSGVKLCRWTKAMLRGRGGCYKHSFYGIGSHQCMEATPSLACANKCVFCWRYLGCLSE
ncbi:S-adenosyl-L-methionine-dependent tRNA 4-demethylwyosine synthase TYW1-like [Octopus sinensis]|uniref:S-adenosyl-L-methionine-dependent tRNA 4-demethylwyosine synthase TYW1-like n=1 Tax=Octopus sinensis TaxID=2607531 RepID=A0A7E6EI16_9MOLL|nr:S-adenosyl-L-methionine-dependent tRNA 4-demethylwyosine synthase TYW1-like [Octopus sinensis]